MKSKTNNKLRKLHFLELYCSKYYKNIDWIDFNEFRSIILKFSENCDDIKEDNDFYNIEDINEEELIKDHKDIHVHKFFRYMPAFLHKHDFFEIIYVYSGTCINYIDGRDVILSQGDIIIIPPYVRHATLCKKEEDICINILIRSSTFDKVFFELLTFNNILSDFFGKVIYSKPHSTHLIFHTAKDESIKSLILSMYEEDERSLKYESTILNGLLMVFFGQLMRNYENSMEMSRDFNNKFEKIDDILEYIHKNYATVTLDELSQNFKFSKFYISKVIKSYTGKNFINIVQDIKMKKAIELITSTNLSIESISSAIGYNSTSTFIRTFKKIYNQSPTEYRNNI